MLILAWRGFLVLFPWGPHKNNISRNIFVEWLNAFKSKKKCCSFSSSDSLVFKSDKTSKDIHKPVEYYTGCLKSLQPICLHILRKKNTNALGQDSPLSYSAFSELEQNCLGLWLIEVFKRRKVFMLVPVSVCVHMRIHVRKISSDL